MTGLGIAVAVLLLLWCALLFVPFPWRPLGIFLFTEKALGVAYVPFIAAIGVALAVVGGVSGSWWIALPAGLAALGALVVIVRVGSVPVDLSGALGGDWNDRVPLERRATMVRRWWTGRLRSDRIPRLRQDVPFATVAGTERVLLCDVWQSPVGVPPSGVAVVYLHGSGYYVFDKDLGTRPLFRHLAAQGHVVVDVAHRLFPEADVPEMVADAKRAVAWVRDHAEDLEVDPDRIALMGGSSGGHLALLAAYSHDESALTPRELAGSDLRVCAVASLYGQVGLDSLYWHTSQDRWCHSDDQQPDWTAPPSRMLMRLFGENAARLRLQFMPYGGRSDWLTGGAPQEVPERYAQASVYTYIQPDCPPTLLMHGTHDEMAPVDAVRQLQNHLEEAGVPVTAVYLPHTDHGFDVIGTRWSPAARVAIYTLERFLAVLGATQTLPLAEPVPHGKEDCAANPYRRAQGGALRPRETLTQQGRERPELFPPPIADATNEEVA
jgi:acetyl esterase/lipase